jgi:hypothetical protein
VFAVSVLVEQGGRGQPPNLKHPDEITRRAVFAAAGGALLHSFAKSTQQASKHIEGGGHSEKQSRKGCGREFAGAAHRSRARAVIRPRFMAAQA